MGNIFFQNYMSTNHKFMQHFVIGGHYHTVINCNNCIAFYSMTIAVDINHNIRTVPWNIIFGTLRERELMSNQKAAVASQTC